MAEHEDQTVDTEGLESALQDLVKAADATDAVKELSKADGVSVEHSGTYSDGKKTSGALASMGDAGGLDDLMIAKMTEAGLDAATISDFQAFMVAKMKGEDEDEEEMDGYMGKVPGMGKSQSADGDVRKSMDDYRSDKDVEDAFDVSPFLEGFTAKTAEQIGGLAKSVRDGQAEQAEVNRRLAAAVYQSGKLLKSQARVIDALSSRLGLVERAPVAAPKGRTAAQPMHKSMPGEAGAPAPDQLTKSQILATLSYMNLEKGMRQLNGTSTSEAIWKFEGGNVIDERTLGAVQQFLTENPSEAAAAKTYS